MDRISNLPDEVICHILSFLPTHNAVVTGILSKRWESLWTHVGTFDFRDDLLPSFMKEESTTLYFEQVDKVLMAQKSEAITKFSLRLNTCYWESYTYDLLVYVTKWISVAAARNVRYLDVVVDVDSYELHHLPGALFSCETLEFLCLRGPFWIEDPETDTTNGVTINLPKLSVLELSEVYYKSGKLFQKLISSCPVLYSLTINRDTGDNMDIFSIYSLSLKFLEIDLPRETYREEYGQLKLDTPALEHLILHYRDICEISSQGLNSLITVEIDDLPYSHFWSDKINLCNSIVEQVFQAVNCAKVMKLSYSTMCGLDALMTRLSTPFDRLIELHIEGDWSKWGHLEDILHCLANLQVLHIKILGCNSECSWRDFRSVPKCLKYKVQQVSFSQFERFNNDGYELVRYILKHGLVLKSIHLGGDDSYLVTRFLMLQKISMFPRASPPCRIELS